MRLFTTSIFSLSCAILVAGSLSLAQVPRAPTNVCINDDCDDAPPSNAPSSNEYTVYDNFENSSLDSKLWATEKNGGSKTGVSISSDFALSGSKSLKSVITRESANDFRAEVKPKMGEAGYLDYNQEVWFGFAVYVPSNFVESDGQDIVMQWHTYSWLESPQESGTSPTFGISLDSGNWKVIRRYNAANPSTSSNQKGGSTIIEPYAKGKWNRWVCRARFHWSNGQSQCWLNDKEVYNENGGNTSNDKYAPYLKFGNYRVANKETKYWDVGSAPRAIYIDNVRVMLEDGSYNAVKP
jgi:hypothetical protein